MAKRLDGKVAVITGAGSGMGAATVEVFCREGASVIAVDISGQEEAVAKKVGGKCIPFHADVSKGKDVQAMLDNAVSAFGRLDVIFNNAGIQGAIAPIGEYREEDYDQVMAVNARSVFLGLRYGIPLLLRFGGGSIISTASMASELAFPSMSAYCAAKGAVQMLTRTAAAEYGKQGIRVNAILPGPIKTGITKALPPEIIGAIEKATPLGYIAEPVQIANLALFLASEESAFITGASVMIDGGYSIL